MRCARDGSRRAYMSLGADYMTNMTEQPRDALACFQWLVDHEEPYHRELGEALLLCDDPRVEEALDEGIADGEVDCYGLRGIVDARGGRLREALDIWAEGASAGDWESGVYAGQPYSARDASMRRARCSSGPLSADRAARGARSGRSNTRSAAAGTR